MKSRLLGIASIVIIITFVLAGFHANPAQAGNSDRFRPSSPTTAGPADDSLFTPQDFEAATAVHPYANSLILVSRCRFLPFSGNPNFYAPFASGTSDAIVGDITVPYAGGTHCYAAQNEANIVVNPTNSKNLLTSANEYRIAGDVAYVSMDGGQTWTNVVLPGWTFSTGGTGLFARMDYCGDPVIAFGPDGTAYYSGLVCNENKVSFFSGVAVAKSVDGGMTWSPPVMVSFTNSPTIFTDKEWITVGQDGTVYLSWTRFQVAKHVYVVSPIVMAKSTDGGATWSDWVAVSDKTHPYNQGSVPLVAPDGTVYVAYEGSTPASGYAADAIILARSTDGGSTFTNVELARAYDDLNCYPINIAQQRQTLSGEQFRINSFPSFAIDPTTGKMAIVWADDQANASCGYETGVNFNGVTSNQVKLITSSDGINWSPVRVITSGAADKVYPAVGANAGRVVVSYYTRAYSPASDDCKLAVMNTTTNVVSTLGGPVCLDYAMRSSTDDFATETRLTNQSSNPYISFSGAFIGDYTGAVVDSAGKGYAVWADFRGNPAITDPNMDIAAAFGK